MNDEDKKTSLLEQINAMSLDDLWVYERASRTTLAVINLVGVSLCLFGLIMESIPVGLGIAFAVYLLSQLSVGVNVTQAHVRERIGKLDKNQS